MSERHPEQPTTGRVDCAVSDFGRCDWPVCGCSGPIHPGTLNGIMQSPTPNEAALVREIDRLQAALLCVVEHCENGCAADAEAAARHALEGAARG